MFAFMLSLLTDQEIAASIMIATYSGSVNNVFRLLLRYTDYVNAIGYDVMIIWPDVCLVLVFLTINSNNKHWS
jgi:hypothetical protein